MCTLSLLYRKVTILDIIERSLRKGKGDEQGTAASLLAVLGVSLGTGGDESGDLILNLSKLLHTILSDGNASPSARAKCTSALAINSFIYSDFGDDDFTMAIDILFTCFSGSFIKGNGNVPELSPATSALHTSALIAWTLLLTVHPIELVSQIAVRHGKELFGLLQSSDVDMRIAAGETLAVIYEICREVDENFEMDLHESLIDQLTELATDSAKFRAKKDRRIQRSSFRDVLRSIESGESPEICVKFGRERLTLDTWCRKRQYDSLCTILGSGMNLHLAENQLVRDIFTLGSPVAIPETTVVSSKMQKLAKHLENVATAKARSKERGRYRDKRADLLE